MFGVNMKRLLLMVSLVAALCMCFTGIAEARPNMGKATGANCTSVGTYTIYWTALDSQMHFGAHVNGCTNVRRIQFTVGGQTPTGAGFFDANDQTCCPYKQSSIYVAQYPEHDATQDLNFYPDGAWVDYHHIPWCGTAHLLQPWFAYRIQNWIAGTWGSYHTVWGPQQWVQC